MTDKPFKYDDEAKILADDGGGWEVLARALYQLHTTGENTLFDGVRKKAQGAIINRAFNPVKRGKKIKYALDIFRVESIVEAGLKINPHEKEAQIIDKNLNEICGEILQGAKERDAANKTVQNALAEHRSKYRNMLKQSSGAPLLLFSQTLSEDESDQDDNPHLL